MDNTMTTNPALHQDLADAVQTAADRTKLADQRLDAINSFQQIINGLPWEDINTGNFRPQRGCPDVKQIRDALIELGCDEELLMSGAVRQYQGTVRTTLTLYYSVEADSDEAAQDAIEALLDGETIYSNCANDLEADLYYGPDIEVEIVE